MKEISTSIKGMNKDAVDLYQSAEMYSYALNAVVENETGDGYILQNEGSNLLGRVFEGEKVIGTLYMPELDMILLFTDGNNIRHVKLSDYSDDYGNIAAPEGSEEVIPLEDRIQTMLMDSILLASSPCFNWTIKHKISVVHKITNNTLNIYFVDGFNEDRYIYFDIKGENYTVNKKFLTNGLIDCNKMKWYPDTTYIDLEVKEVSGGQLQSGVYQFFAAYSTSKGINLNTFKGGTNPLHIATKVEIDKLDYETNRGILVKLKNVDVDSPFKYITIVALATVGGISTYRIAGILPIKENITFTYSSHNGIKVDETIIFQSFPYYRSSKRLTKANNRLIKAKLEEYEKINIQRIANKLSLKWFTITAKEGDYKKSDFASKYRGYLRDEIYTVGIKFILSNGEETHVGHIPGRVKTRFDLSIQASDNSNKDILQTDGGNCEPIDYQEKWQQYNTAREHSKQKAVYDECNPSTYNEGVFGYWESSEVYPDDKNIWGDLAGTPIRHHLMPDCLVAPHHNGNKLEYKGYQSDNLIFPIGIKLDDTIDIDAILLESVHEGIITEDQKNRIVGYKILRGNRAANKSINAKGLLYNMYTYKENNTLYNYANYPFNDLRLDPYISFQKYSDIDQRFSTIVDDFGTNFPNIFQPNKRYTFHSPDTHFNQPEIGNILKVEAEVYGEAEGFFNKSEDYAEYKILSDQQYLFSIIMGTLMGNMLSYTKDGAAGAAQSIGQTVGGVAGAALGGPVGSVLGSTLGSILGGIIDDNNDKPFEKLYKNILVLSQSEKLIDLFKLAANYENYHWQYQAVGRYSNIVPVPNSGNKQRLIKTHSYLNSSRQTVGSVFINNNKRESSLFIELEEDIIPTSIEDTSRFLISSSQAKCDYRENDRLKSIISSYYVSLKRRISNQYGGVYDIHYIPVSGKVWKTNEKFKEFGGDTYINRFAIKRKQTFFSQDAFALPNDTDIFYEDYSNMGRSRYYFNTQNTQQSDYDLTGKGPLSIFLKDLNSASIVLQQILTDLTRWRSKKDAKLFSGASIQELGALLGDTLLNPFVQLKPPRHHFDCQVGNYSENRLSTKSLGGKIYTHSTGIPYFICESDVNVDLRHAEDSLEKNFYPNQKDLAFWLQEKNVKYTIDNFFGYNKDFSKQNREDISVLADANFFEQKDNIIHKNKVIMSLDGVEVDDINYRDNYLYFKPLDSFNFSYENGELIAIDSIEGEKVLVRFENNTRIFNTFDTLKTQNGIVALDSGGLFGGRPQEYSKTDLGFFGCQHDDIINTEFGHIIVDCKRGQIFILKPNGGPMEISNKFMKSWFLQNLPFQISNYFDVNVNNSYDGIGIAMCYDNRYKRLLLTKLDYVPRFSDIYYESGEFYYNRQRISIYDKYYFDNISWTISYNMQTESWRSFHSYTPNYYIPNLKTFYSGLNRENSSLWGHNLTNKSYQVYYGELYPFIVESSTKPNIQATLLESVEFLLDVYRFHNREDSASRHKIAFNKAIVYNKNQSTGLMQLNMVDENDIFDRLKYPIQTNDHTKIEIIEKEGLFSFNQLINKKVNNLPQFITDKDGVSEYINKAALDYTNLSMTNDYLRDKIHKIRLINDKHSSFKFIYKGLISNILNSIR